MRIELCCGACAEFHELDLEDAQRLVLALQADRSDTVQAWKANSDDGKEFTEQDICLLTHLDEARDVEAYFEYVDGALEAARSKAGRDNDEEEGNPFDGSMEPRRL